MGDILFIFIIGYTAYAFSAAIFKLFFLFMRGLGRLDWPWWW